MRFACSIPILLRRRQSWPGYNREHVWPVSLGAADGTPAHTDLHHIFACDANVNSARGNRPYDECEGDCNTHIEAPRTRPFLRVLGSHPITKKGTWHAHCFIWMFDMRVTSRMNPTCASWNGAWRQAAIAWGVYRESVRGMSSIRSTTPSDNAMILYTLSKGTETLCRSPRMGRLGF